MKETSIALVGIGGYGNIYLDHLLGDGGKKSRENGAQLVAGIDPYAENSGNVPRLKEAGVPIYPDLETFLKTETADLVIISAAIHLHLPLTRLALDHGAHVLCEKPLTATVLEAQEMLAAADAAGKIVAIGYQWSFSSAVQSLKADILAGRFGDPIRLKTKVFWPRTASYYGRNDWAGAVKSSTGEWVLDSPMHNATAHYLHNMLYLLGAETEESGFPVEFQAECFRANNIENFDAAALRCYLEGGAEILFYTAHCVPDLIGPIFHYEFEDGVVEYLPDPMKPDDIWHRTFVARFKDGSSKDYGDPNEDDGQKLWQTVRAIQSQDREGSRSPGSRPPGSRPPGIVCGIRAAIPQVMCVNAAWLSAEIVQFPQELVNVQPTGNGDTLTWVNGVQENFELCYEENKLPGETSRIAWSATSRKVTADEITQTTAIR